MTWRIDWQRAGIKARRDWYWQELFALRSGRWAARMPVVLRRVSALCA